MCFLLVLILSLCIYNEVPNKNLTRTLTSIKIDVARSALNSSRIAKISKEQWIRTRNQPKLTPPIPDATPTSAQQISQPQTCQIKPCPQNPPTQLPLPPLPRTHKVLFLEPTPKPPRHIPRRHRKNPHKHNVPSPSPPLPQRRSLLSLKGHIAEADIDNIGEVCRGIKPPDKQVNMQGRRLDQGVGVGSELLSSKIAV